MAGITVDLIAPGPPTDDPYDPAAPAWALAEGFSRRGASVQVVHPAGEARGIVPRGVATADFPALPRHLGSARGDAELARSARERLRREAELIVRDPLRPGALGLSRGARSPRLLALVRADELTAFEPGDERPAGRGVRAKLEQWRERSVLRRLEREALDEAETIYCEAPELVRALTEDFGVAPARLRQLPRAVALPASPPTRAEARRRIGIPADDPLVVALASSDDPDDPGLVRTREAFVRIRPIFAGAHLALAGATTSGGNAITVLPGRDLTTLVTAVVAADVAVFPRSGAGFDPGAALALCAGVACVVSASVRLPDGAGSAVRRVAGEEGGDLASTLAELLADPAARRELSRRGTAYGARFAPERVAGELAGDGGASGPG